MEALRARLKAFAGSHVAWSLAPLRIDEDYSISEVSDTYGFSHVNFTVDNSDDTVDLNLAERFRHDENWNNPESVALMLQAYNIANSHMSLDMSTNVEQALQYLETKKQQQKMFSRRNLIEGNASLMRMTLADSIHKFNESLRFDRDNVHALHGRAQAYWLLNDRQNARRDILAAMSLDINAVPEHSGAHELFMDEQRKHQSVLSKRVTPSQVTASSRRHESAIKLLEETLGTEGVVISESDSDDQSSSESSEQARRKKSKKRKHKHKHKHKNKRRHKKDKSKERSRSPSDK